MKTAGRPTIRSVLIENKPFQQGEHSMKGKMNLPLKEFLTLVGPAQVLHIIEEGETEPAFKDRSVKIRDHEELLDREVKFIQPAADTENAGKYIFKIWIYPVAA